MCEPRALEVKTGVVGSDGRAGEASRRLAALGGEIVVLIASEEPPELPASTVKEEIEETK